MNTTIPSSFVPSAEVRLSYSERESVPLVTIGSDVLAVAGVGRRHAALLEDLCTRNLPRVAWISDVEAPDLTLQVHTFLHALPLPPTDFGVDEKILETLARINRALRSPPLALEWLHDQFLLPEQNGAARAFATADVGGDASAFALHGRSARAFLRREKSSRGETLIVDRVTRSAASSTRPLALVSGELRFVDATVAGKLRVDAAAELSSLVDAGSSFLEVWQRYGELENDAALRRARRAGWLGYEHVESLGDGRFRFTLQRDIDITLIEGFETSLREESGLSIDAEPKVPAVLARDMSWSEYKAQPREVEDRATFEGRIELNRRERTLVLSQRSTDEGAPPARGVLFISLLGDRTRLKRREDAGTAIRDARCPMPQLRLLLEGRAVPTPRRGAVKPITPSVRRKVFGERSPTPMQEEALRVALNTPDIALIQGPPGTGKTTIIVALVERLQEVWDSSEGIQGRLLLSGFQHDAVENAIQRMSVNGLPPIKFGGRQDRRVDADRIDLTIDRWARERAAEIRERHPTPAPSALQAELTSVLESYVLAPGTLEQTASLLLRVAGRVQSEVPAALISTLSRLAHELEDMSNVAYDVDRNRLVVLVRALRSIPAAFADDGPRNCFRLSQELERQQRLTMEARDLLERASRWLDNDVPPFLDEIRALRRQLLLDLIPNRTAREVIPNVRSDVVEILSRVRDELDRRHRSSRNAVDEAVFSFLHSLDDLEAVKQAVFTYTSVFAATCQQSARKALTQLKGAGGYDTVVVDEAARANPLDLFVPLAQASRRIVLVGDHRQLPHVLDRELERELEEGVSSSKSADDQASDMLNQSLFERLFKDLRSREKRDGIRRTVTLDEQYRMHPLLGDFVSTQFYASRDPQEAFRSPRPAAEFEHGLPGYRGPAAWLDVPSTDGYELGGKSKSRRVEAVALVAELKRLMDCDAGKKLTFGVISFYSAQVELLTEELERFGILDRAEDGSIDVADDYRELQLARGRSIDRFRVGTVDAFQGMEFDVVFLSMVRSNNHRDESEPERRRKYGHLMSSNRLCVAMSRQKRLLIVVGDRTMLRAPRATSAIGPLVKFAEMSEVRERRV
jgi:superfamily I DNA and/or RNA helicase